MFLGDWVGCAADEMYRDFFEYGKKDTATLDPDIEILLAYYSYKNYSGEAFVLFKQNAKLYEVNGSHCSCYGLENQWEPEETTVEALLYRLNNSRYFGRDCWDNENIFANELKQILEQL